MINSAGYHHGDSAFYVGETPCDSKTWTNHGVAPPPKPCQRKPKWTLLKNDRSYENVLGYSGTNSKYVKIVESAFYNNGAGIVPNTLDSEGFEPNGWNVFEGNDVFWNNYNYFLAGSTFHTVSGGLGQVGGSDGQLPDRGRDRPLRRRRQRRQAQQRVRQLQVGHRLLLGTRRSLRRQRGRRRQEHQQPDRRKHDGPRRRRPQRRIRLLERRHRRRQLLGRQQRRRDLRARQRQSAAEPDLPGLPADRQSLADQVRSLDIVAGLQINLGEESDPKTILGYAELEPAAEPAVHLGPARRRRTRRSRSSSRSRSRRSRAK